VGAIDEIYVKTAREVADDAVRVMREPPLPSTPARLDGYPHLDVAFYERTTSSLEDQGFRVLRDVDASPLVVPGSPPPVVRVLLDEGTTSAALFHVVPKNPGFIYKLLLRFTGRWIEPRIVELWTWFDDVIVATTNAGEASFFSAPPWMKRTHLRLGASALEVLERHRALVDELRLATGKEPRRFLGWEDLEAAREENRVRSNAWRREIGGILPEELDRMLAPHGEHGRMLRPHLEREIAARVAVMR
jgi:hypothetical protein